MKSQPNYYHHPFEMFYLGIDYPVMDSKFSILTPKHTAKGAFLKICPISQMGLGIKTEICHTSKIGKGILLKICPPSKNGKRYKI
jgi:hypothetical protein